ncbi:MAG: hypothetical protein U1A77_16400 [Pirellulales bacterium]
MSHLDFDRRRFLHAAGGAVAASAWMNSPLAPNASLPVNSAIADEPSTAPRKAEAADGRRKLRVAAINSIYRLRSHAYHICGRVIHGFQRNGFHHQPQLQLVRMFNDQYPPDDLGREYGKRYQVEVCDSVAAALGGDNSLDVDAVLLIIEHGDYPVNDWNQVLYPRYEMFERIVQVFRKSGKTAPIFVDKHLSYDHQLAAKMVRTAREMGFGLMAGSSLPVTWRVPQIEPPLGTPFTEGLVTFGFDRGAPEIYLFHALEVLQCMLERRAGGETGVKSVECLEGDAVWKALEAGRMSETLLQAALRVSPSNNVGPVRENVKKPLAILVEYRDGARGSVVNLIEQVSDFSFAGFQRGSPLPVASNFYLPIPPGARFFDPLVWNIEQFFHSNRSPYPVERTLLTSTVLDLALHALKDGKPSTSPALDIRYSAPADSGFFRGPVEG